MKYFQIFSVTMAFSALLITPGWARQDVPTLKAFYFGAGKSRAATEQRNGRLFALGSQGERGPRMMATGETPLASIKAPTIDGVMDDTVWENAVFASGFLQREPEDGRPGTEETRVAVIYDDMNLYIGIRCLDKESSKIVVNEMRNDAELENDDNVRIIIDTYNDKRNGFLFQTNAIGARRDSKITDEGRNVNDDWNIVWEVKSKITDQGWNSEIRIPLNQLRYPDAEGVHTWGINFARVIRRKREDVYWAPITRDDGFGERGFYKVSRAGTLTGMGYLPRKKRLEVKPYSLSGLQHDFTEGSEKSSVFDVGADVKYGLTANLIADLTLNTDFAQVESDQERVNLTRFSLFFPEKREFFLEGAGVFSMGQSGRPGRGSSEQLFYSRRIGLEDGNEVPIIAGSKVTGNVSGMEVGLLNVLTDKVVDEADSTNNLNRTNFSALRLKKPVFSRSSIGAMILSKDIFNNGGANRTFSIDGNFTLGPVATLNTWIAKTTTTGSSGNDFAGKASFNYRTDKWRVGANYTDIQDKFNPEMGFIRRTNIKKADFEFGNGFRPRSIQWMQRMYNALTLSYTASNAGNLLTRDVGMRTFVQFKAGHIFFGGPGFTYDTIDEDWEIFDKDDEHIIISPGAYDFFSYRFFFRSDESKPFSLQLGGNAGGFYGGRRYNGSLGTIIRPSSHFSVDLSYDRNQVELPVGNFATNVVSTRLIYTFSRDMFAKAYFQWNDRDESVSLNLLFNYYYGPGSNIFLVYNQGWEDESGLLITQNRTLLLKLNYWLNM